MLKKKSELVKYFYLFIVFGIYFLYLIRGCYRVKNVFIEISRIFLRYFKGKIC